VESWAAKARAKVTFGLVGVMGRILVLLGSDRPFS
jgi:hypothetical protein